VGVQPGFLCFWDAPRFTENGCSNRLFARAILRRAGQASTVSGSAGIFPRSWPPGTAADRRTLQLDRGPTGASKATPEQLSSTLVTMMLDGLTEAPFEVGGK